MKKYITDIDKSSNIAPHQFDDVLEDESADSTIDNSEVVDSKADKTSSDSSTPAELKSTCKLTPESVETVVKVEDFNRRQDNEAIKDEMKLLELQPHAANLLETGDKSETKSSANAANEPVYEMVALFKDDGFIDKFVLKDKSDPEVKDDNKIGCSSWLSKTMDVLTHSAGGTTGKVGDNKARGRKVQGDGENKEILAPEDEIKHLPSLNRVINGSRVINSDVCLDNSPCNETWNGYPASCRVDVIAARFDALIYGIIDQVVSKYFNNCLKHNVDANFDKLHSTVTKAINEHLSEDKSAALNIADDKLSERYNKLDEKIDGLSGKLLTFNVKLEDVISVVDKRFTSVDDNIANLVSKLNEAFEKFNSISTEISAADEDRLGTLDGKVEEVTMKLQAVNSGITKFSDRFEDIAGKFNDSYSRFDGLFSKFTEFEKYLVEFDDKFSNLLTDKITVLNDKFANLTSRLDELKDLDIVISNIKNITDGMDGLLLNGTNVTGTFDNLNNKADDLSGKLNEIDITNNRLHDRLNNISGKIGEFDKVTNNIGDISNKIHEIQERLNELKLHNIGDNKDQTPPNYNNKLIAFDVKDKNTEQNVSPTGSSTSLKFQGLNPEDKDVLHNAPGVISNTINGMKGIPTHWNGNRVSYLNETPNVQNSPEVHVPLVTNVYHNSPMSYGTLLNEQHLNAPLSCQLDVARTPTNSPSMIGSEKCEVSWIPIDGKMIKHTREHITLPELALQGYTPNAHVDLSMVQHLTTPVSNASACNNPQRYTAYTY